MFRKKEKTLEEIIKEKGYDPYLLSQIQPFGGLSTRDEKYINSATDMLSVFIFHHMLRILRYIGLHN